MWWSIMQTEGMFMNIQLISILLNKVVKTSWQKADVLIFIFFHEFIILGSNVLLSFVFRTAFDFLEKISL